MYQTRIMRTGFVAALTGLVTAVILTACSGGGDGNSSVDGGGGGPPPAVTKDAFIAKVIAVTAATPDNTDPEMTESVAATSPDSDEPDKTVVF